MRIQTFCELERKPVPRPTLSTEGGTAAYHALPRVELATMSSPEMVAMQMQLQASADQLQMVSNALDLLRHESGAAFVDLRRLLAEAREVTKHANRVSFVNIKSFEGGKKAQVRGSWVQILELQFFW